MNGTRFSSRKVAKCNKQGQWHSKASLSQRFRYYALKLSLFSVAVIALALVYTFVAKTQTEESEFKSDSLTSQSLKKLTEPSLFKDAYLQANCPQLLLDKFQTMRVIGKVEQAKQSFDFRFLKKRPNKLIYIADAGHTETRYVVNEDRVWRSTPNLSDTSRQFDELIGEQALQWKKQSNFFQCMLGCYTGQSIIESIDLISESDEPALKVDIRELKYSKRTTVIVDPKTMYTVKEITKESLGQMEEIIYSDHRLIDGMIVTFHITKRVNGITQSVVKLTSVDFNIGIPDSFFY